MHINKSVLVAAATVSPGLAHYTKECKVNTYFVSIHYILNL